VNGEDTQIDVTLIYGERSASCTVSLHNPYKNYSSFVIIVNIFMVSRCRNTQAIFDSCMKEKLGMERPHIGYHTEARLHESTRPKPPPEKPKYFPGGTPQYPPDDIPRPPAGRQGMRNILD
jgi:hypothetical protein